MQKPFMRIPYTAPLPPPPLIVPRTAESIAGAVDALCTFLTAPRAAHLREDPAQQQQQQQQQQHDQTVLLTGAGISVASGLADYRGTAGTYTLNRTYRPIYYSEFLESHRARQRYWARSFLGWTNLHRARPNAAHYAVKGLGELGLVRDVITQNVDSFHTHAHPQLPTTELHGYLRNLVCVNCHNELPRDEFQRSLSHLNPAWASFLADLLAAGALDSEHPEERKSKGLRTNPDGDVDLPDAPWNTFRYPACPTCLANPPLLSDGSRARVGVDADGAWSPSSTAGVLKPAVVMFGESTKPAVKAAAEQAVDSASRILVIGSSLATYSAWRLVKRAQDRRLPIAVLNLGGVRGEEKFFPAIDDANRGAEAVRCSLSAQMVLPTIVERLGGGSGGDGEKSVDHTETSANRAAMSASLGRME